MRIAMASQGVLAATRWEKTINVVMMVPVG
jgi:hypothetical protein